MKNHLDYIPRIIEYYQILGYGKPYQWAQFDTVPFTPLAKPLKDVKLGIVTTAAPFQQGQGDQGPGAAHNGKAKFFNVYTASTDSDPDLRISHIAYDRQHSPANDQASYFPLAALKKLQVDGIFQNLSERFYGLPTNRSQRTTIDKDCVDLVKLCQEDQIDAAILVPNCPVCHQSVSLAARALESSGITTVISGCARDIVEHVGVPRLLFNNFPLGNSAGLPGDRECQIAIAQMALDLLQNAEKPRTTIQSPFEWNGNKKWQQDYSNATILSEEEIARRRAEFDQTKNDAKQVKSSST